MYNYKFSHLCFKLLQLDSELEVATSDSSDTEKEYLDVKSTPSTAASSSSATVTAIAAGDPISRTEEIDHETIHSEVLVPVFVASTDDSTEHDVPDPDRAVDIEQIVQVTVTFIIFANLLKIIFLIKNSLENVQKLILKKIFRLNQNK